MADIYKTSNLYQAASIIWETGIYPDRYDGPDGRGLVSAVWDNDKDIRPSIDKYEGRTLRVCPRGFSVIHINLKRKIKSIKGAIKDE